MASSSTCPNEVGTPDQRQMEEWAAVTGNINEELRKLEKDNDETIEEIEECFGTLTDEVSLFPLKMSFPPNHCKIKIFD
jgi:hypothetical protein